MSRREIRNALGLADSTVRGWLTELVELEYVASIDGGGRGKTVRYALHERLPKPKARSRVTQARRAPGKVSRVRESSRTALANSKSMKARKMTSSSRVREENQQATMSKKTERLLKEYEDDLHVRYGETTIRGYLGHVRAFLGWL